MGKKRSSRGGGNGSSEVDSTLNQLLVEMDGFEGREGIVVFGATNRKNLLDIALLRPGRFDRVIDVALPTLEGREEILKVHLNKLKLVEETESSQKEEEEETFEDKIFDDEIEILLNATKVKEKDIKEIKIELDIVDEMKKHFDEQHKIINQIEKGVDLNKEKSKSESENH